MSTTTYTSDLECVTGLAFKDIFQSAEGILRMSMRTIIYLPSSPVHLVFVCFFPAADYVREPQ